MIVNSFSNHNNCNFAGAVYGKHKVPRFIYHMTNKSNYESMLKDGFIKTSVDGAFGKGVFATELTNLFKWWQKDKSWENASMQECLIRQVAKGKDDIVILKIPTANLDHDKLKVRSQNSLFSWKNSDTANKMCDEIDKEFDTLKPKDGESWLEKYAVLVRKHIKKQESSTVVTHLMEGTPAKNSGLFEQRGEAIEYIYKEDIPISDVQKIGEVNVWDLRHSNEYDPIRPMKSIFSALLKGTPQENAAKRLNC